MRWVCRGRRQLEHSRIMVYALIEAQIEEREKEPGISGRRRQRINTQTLTFIQSHPRVRRFSSHTRTINQHVQAAILAHRLRYGILKTLRLRDVALDEDSEGGPVGGVSSVDHVDGRGGEVGGLEALLEEHSGGRVGGEVRVDDEGAGRGVCEADLGGGC